MCSLLYLAQERIFDAMMLPKRPWQAYDVMSRLVVPIVSAPMHGVSGAELAGSVAKAGGLGFIGSGFAKEADQMQRSGNLAGSCASYDILTT